MKYPYKTRKGGATVTVFVPYDCGNHCPFCINKGEYSDVSGFDEDKIIESIKLMDSITPECDFVFTGGEPFADRHALQEMLDVLPNTHNIYINTTLPVFEGQSEEDILEFAEKNKDKVSCINISRHLVQYVEESPDSLIAAMPVKTRVNCVLFENYPSERIPEYLNRWLDTKIPVQFRYDYTATTPENLYDRKDDRIFNDLNRFAEYKGLMGCRMRNGFVFDYKGLEITYHKTLPYSTILEKDHEDDLVYAILYDIIIKQNGDIHSDWDDRVMDYNLDVEAYRNAKIEEYDLKVLEGDLKI
jgi:organic radical activating enzyme